MSGRKENIQVRKLPKLGHNKKKKNQSCPLLSGTNPVSSEGMTWPSYYKCTLEKRAEEMLCLHLEGLWGPSTHSPAVYQDRETRPGLSNL